MKQSTQRMLDAQLDKALTPRARDRASLDSLLESYDASGEVGTSGPQRPELVPAMPAPVVDELPADERVDETLPEAPPAANVEGLASVPAAGKGRALTRKPKSSKKLKGTVATAEKPPSCNTLPTELEHYETLWKMLHYSESRQKVLRVFFNVTHGGENRNCYIKARQLEEWTKIDERQIRQIMADLRQIGWIIKRRDYNGADQLGVLYEVPRELPSSVAITIEKFKRLAF